MKMLLYVCFILLLVVNLISFVALVRHCLGWFKLRRSGESHQPFGLYMVQSPLFALMIGTMSIAFGLSGAPEFGGTVSLWPWSMAWWVGVVYGVGVLILGAVLAVKAKRLPSHGAEAFDERTEAIGLRADKATLWTLYLYLLGRGIVEFAVAPMDAPINLFHQIATNPWFQTVGVLFLVSSAMQTYFNRRLS